MRCQCWRFVEVLVAFGEGAKNSREIAVSHIYNSVTESGEIPSRVSIAKFSHYQSQGVGVELEVGGEGHLWDRGLPRPVVVLPPGDYQGWGRVVTYFTGERRGYLRGVPDLPQMTSTAVKVVIWSLVAFVVLFIALGVAYRLVVVESSGVPAATYESEYDPFGFWGPVYSSADTTRNQCRLYNFPGSSLESPPPVCSALHGSPGQATMDAKILDMVEPTSLPGCYDVDQVVAAKVDHTCITTVDLEAGDYAGVNAAGQEGISFCTRLDGTRAAIGEVESIYAKSATLVDPVTGEISSVSCSTQPCAGTLAFYAVNYKVVSYNSGTRALDPIRPVCAGSNTYGLSVRCLAEEDGTIQVRPCEMGDPDQLFRVTRTDPGQSVPNTGSTLGKSGLVAQIYNRSTGQCVRANAAQTQLELGTCRAEWALIPEIRGTTRSSVQQTAWVGDLTEEQVTSLLTADSYDDLLLQIGELGIRTIQLTPESRVELLPYATYAAGQYRDNDAMAATQYIDYTLYNSILFTTSPYAF